MPPRRPFVLASLFWTALAATVFGQEPDLRTVAERTDYKATATSAQILDLCQRLDARSDAVRLAELGRSHEGKPIPLLIVADPPLSEPKERADRLVVLLFGNIHAGEVDGKEALPMLVRELTDKPGHPLLKDLVLLVAPNYNPDGNDKMAKDNRPGQVGPEEGMGRRENAQGLDLNRDFVKLEAPETRALVDLIDLWNPHIVVDCHTTNGSYHRYTITHAGPKSPAGDRRIIDYVDDHLLKDVGDALLKESTWRSFPYGNFNREHDRWSTFAAEPRYSTNYVGLRNRLAVLSEAYSYAPFKDRVLATRDFCRAILNFAAGHKAEIASLLAEAAKGGTVGEPVAVRAEPKARKEPVAALGFEETPDPDRPRSRPKLGEPKEYRVALWDDFAAKETVPRPAAYLVPARHRAAIETLQRHGLDVKALREDVALEVEADRLDAVRREERPFQGHRTVQLDTTRRTETRAIPAGTAVVAATGPLGSLAVMLLDARSEDGLATWNAFDDGLDVGKDFPVLRLPQPTAAPLLTRPLRPLAGMAPRPVETAPIAAAPAPAAQRFGGPPRGGSGFVRWLDADHFVQTREGKSFQVEALTGKAEPSDAAEPAPNPIGRGRATTPAPPGGELAEASPDGKSLAFIRDNDLYVQDTATKAEKALTTGGSDRVRRGKADWVYFEEIFNRNWKAYWWSPGSKHIAFLEFDDRHIPTHHILIDTNEPRKVEETAYPRPGEPNPRVRFGVVAVEDGTIRYADLSAYDPDDFLISDVGWWPDGSSAYFYGQNRTQTWLDLIRVAAADAATTKLFRETTGAWVESPGPIAALKDGTFLLKSERDGWKHIYRYNADGTPKNRVTSGDWELRAARGGSEVVRLDEEAGWVYVTGTKPQGLGLNLYRARLDGSGVELLTKEPGSHDAALNPDGTLFVDQVNGREIPPTAVLRKADGTFVRTIDSGTERPDVDPKSARREVVTIPARDGFPLEAEVILPAGLDDSGKTLYPVWLMTYGGPHAPTISEAWRGSAGPIGLEASLVNEGMIVFRVDPRSASGKGAKSAWTAYRKLGVQELEDIRDALAWLKRRPYIDSSRIGMSGHSYGGYLTAFCLTHSDLFAAGIAGAPVTDWRDYDSIYTERYMGTPQENPEGYKASSVVEAAKDLHGKLLILHGAIDDNVSMRNSMRLVHALQQADKDFEMMIYPSSRHGIGGAHYQRLQRDFIKRTLGGPKPKP